MGEERGVLEELLDGAIVNDDSGTSVLASAYAWARVSTDMQEERGLSIQEQLREIRSYAGDNGIRIMGEFSEAASAFQNEEKRVEFRRMLDEARRNKEVEAIIVHDTVSYTHLTLPTN